MKISQPSRRSPDYKDMPTATFRYLLETRVFPKAAYENVPNGTSQSSISPTGAPTDTDSIQTAKYKYTSIPNAEQQIRLLQLLPYGHQDRVQSIIQ